MSGPASPEVVAAVGRLAAIVARRPRALASVSAVAEVRERVAALRAAAPAIVTRALDESDLEAVLEALRWSEDDPELARMEDVLGQVLQDNGEAALAELGLETQFHADTPAARAWLERKVIEFAQHVDDTTIEALREELLAGRAEGETLAQLAARVDEVFDGRKSNALTVARTETLGPANYGRMAAYLEADLERHQWSTQRDEHVRDEHRAMEGEVVAIGEPFSNGLRFPGDTDGGDVVQFVNCVLPGTRISGRILSALKAFYAGEAVEIVTASGDRVAVTVNHPVLTPYGVRPAGSLREGDHVIRQDRDADRGRPRGDDEKEHVVATAEDIFDALAAGGAVRTHGPSPLHLDGDGEFLRGKIHEVMIAPSHSWDPSIVPDGDLAREIHTARLKLDEQLALVASDVAPTAPAVTLSAAAGSPRCGALTLDSGRVVSEGAPFDGLRLGSAARFDVALKKSLSDDVSVDAESVRELVLALAGQVEPDEIVEVNRFPYVGHVYDFSTEVGYFSSDNIITRNCRCDVYPIIPGVERSAERLDVQWRAFSARLVVGERLVARQWLRMLRAQQARARAAIARAAR